MLIIEQGFAPFIEKNLLCALGLCFVILMLHLFDINLLDMKNTDFIIGLSLYGVYEFCMFLYKKFDKQKIEELRKKEIEHEVDFVDRKYLKKLLLLNISENKNNEERICNLDCPFLNKCDECLKRNSKNGYNPCSDCSNWEKNKHKGQTERGKIISCHNCSNECKHKLTCKVFTKYDFFTLCYSLGCKDKEFLELFDKEDDFCMLKYFKDNENIQKLIKEIENDIKKEKEKD